MSKEAKQLPHQSVALWIGAKAIDWARWEALIAKEISKPGFEFSIKQKARTRDAIKLMERCDQSVVTIEYAKETVRRSRARLVQDILIAVVDGLKGFPQAIEAAFPQTQVQTCIVHLLRHSMSFARFERRAIDPVDQS